MRTVDPEHSVYNFSAWMYHSEYTFHAHAWWLLGWADGKGIPVISDFAESAKDAHVVPNDPFYDYKYAKLGGVRTFFYIVEGLLGF